MVNRLNVQSVIERLRVITKVISLWLYLIVRVMYVAQLFFAYKKADSDDQWLYLPALKRVKRIASSNKAGPFMGSEFSYDDIASQEVEKYTYNYLRDEEFNGFDCFVIEYDPVDPKSGYKRQIVWMDKAEYRVHKIDFYDRKDALLKTLTNEYYNQYLDQFWRSNRLDMINNQTGKKTQLVFADWKFQTGITERDFEKSALKRTR